MSNHLTYTLGDIKAVARIIHVRQRMKAENYFPTEQFEDSDYNALSSQPHRSGDGSGTDPRRPHMGKAGTAFGRNVPPQAVVTEPEIDTPDPRIVSDRLLKQHADHQQLAPSLNMLAAAWIQFQVHDWFDHRTSDEQIGLQAGERLAAMQVDRSATRESQLPFNVFSNTQGHWWDASQIYGASQEISRKLRLYDMQNNLLRAELQLDGSTGEPRLPKGAPFPRHDSDRVEVELSGFVKNWWIGLSVLHTVFAREHNLIVSELRKTQSAKTPDIQAYENWLFETARLIVSAIMAKIHTVEWTPTLLNVPPLQLAMFADWWGLGQDGAAETLHKLDAIPYPNDTIITEEVIQKLMDSGLVDDELGENLSRIILDGKPPARHSPAPMETGLNGEALTWAFTEEFVSVYRMHALLRDEISLRRGDGSSESWSLEEMSFEGASTAADEFGISQLTYSLAKENAAALRLNNYPRSLSRLNRPGTPAPVDLGAIDVLRDRERGVPRYVAFKKWVSKITGPSLLAEPTPPVRTFQDICGDPDDPGISAAERARRLRDAELLSTTYGSVEDVDLLVGMLAEPLHPGFAFSWTGFEIFLLMAVFRLSLDRFFTTDFHAGVYTEFGIDWINHRTLGAMLCEHLPELKSKLRENGNPFLIEEWR